MLSWGYDAPPKSLDQSSDHSLSARCAYSSSRPSNFRREINAQSPVDAYQRSHPRSRPDRRPLSRADLSRKNLRNGHVSDGLKRSRRGASSSTASQAEYYCLQPNCNYSSTRAYDLKRHTKAHFPADQNPCPYSWYGCDRKPFSRKDHLMEDLRKSHAEGVQRNFRRAAIGVK